MKRVYCLYRVSTAQQVDVVKDDIPMQRIACHDFAARMGWTILVEKEEKGISGFKVGSGLPNIQKGSLAGFPVKLPRLQMQQSIVRVLDALTNKKEIEIALLKQLQSQKTYLLSKMFI